MTGKTRKIQWMAALLLIGTAGGTMAGPGIGPYGPWNSGGAFGGFGPYQPYVARGYNVKEGLSTNYWVSRRPARMITTTIRRAEPVAEQTTCSTRLAPVAQRVTTVRQTRLIMPSTANRVWTKERRIIRPARMVTTTQTELLPANQIEAVGEQIISVRPSATRRVILSAPACGAGDHIYR